MRSGRLAVQQAGARQNKGAGADRHRDIGACGGVANPGLCCLAGRTLCGDDDDLRRGSIGNRIFGRDLHSAARVNGSGGFRHGIEAEGIKFTTGNADPLKDFPRTAKINDHCALGDKKGHRDRCISRRGERIGSQAYFGGIECFTAAPGNANVPTAAKLRAAER